MGQRGDVPRTLGRAEAPALVTAQATDRQREVVGEDEAPALLEQLQQLRHIGRAVPRVRPACPLPLTAADHEARPRKQQATRLAFPIGREQAACVVEVQMRRHDDGDVGVAGNRGRW